VRCFDSRTASVLATAAAASLSSSARCGVAFANVKYSNSYVAFSPAGAGFDFENAAASQTRVGWAAGGGIEYALTPHVILSAEYLHVDLGSITATGGVTTQLNANTATFNFSTKVTSDIVRVGAAYKF
jgi:outer membrane immunogenic protein